MRFERQSGPRVSRRDVIKLMALAPASVPLAGLLQRLEPENRAPNFIILVFDALAAANMSLYGYPRATTPNLERLADGATVFHAHYSAGSSTPPGTSSLLTGMYPWTHRALSFRYPVRRALVNQNIFAGLGDGYHRLAFTQNLLAQVYLDQFHAQIDTLLSPAAFSARNYLAGDKLTNDPNARYRALEFFALSAPPGSLLFGTANQLLTHEPADAQRSFIAPYGNNFYFRLGDVFSGLAAQLEALPQPFVAYVHLYPPHAPYTPSAAFADHFRDGWEAPLKQWHALGGRSGPEAQHTNRRVYDAFLANIDSEFGRFMDYFGETETFKSSYFILTSDHGEMFERGAIGHESPLLYDAGVRVPLVIWSPDSTARSDVFAPTNSVDLLPTLATLAGRPIPDWCEGVPLPGFGGQESDERASFVFESKGGAPLGRLARATMVLRRAQHKLIYYVGYTGYPGYRNDPIFEKGKFELFDLVDDPEERRDRTMDSPALSASLQAELLEKFDVVSRSLL